LIEKEVEFEVLREPWNKYSIDDGSYIKTKFVALKFKKREPTTADEKVGYGFEGQNIMVVYHVPEELKGKPSTEKYSPEQLSEGATDMKFSIVYEEWNEYVLKDGTVVRIKSTAVEIARSTKFDRNGDPIYVVNTSQILGLKPKKVT